MRLRSLIPLALVMFLASCSESTGLEQNDLEVPQFLGQIMTTANYDAEARMLRQVSSAPPLETYELGFWAVKGEAKTVRVDYDDVQCDPDDGDAEDTEGCFMRFHIPSNGLAAYPDGTPMVNGDSVYITASIEAGSYHVDFGPSGLQFNQDAPADIEMWYYYADPDIDGDGDVDDYDQKYRMNLGYWYNPDYSDAWYRVISANDGYSNWTRTLLYHFSGYAVCF